MNMRSVSQSDLDLVRGSGLFDPDWYLAEYQDVAKLGMDPFDHFIKIGLKLLRSPGPRFDTRHYVNTYEDVRKHKINPILHYLKHGQKEGRQPVPRQNAAEANYACLPDADGNLAIPNRHPGNGRHFQSLSFNKDHYWYKNQELDRFVEAVRTRRLLPDGLRRILVLAHDFKLTTGVTRPISHYLNAMTAVGGHEFTSIELAPNAAAAVLKTDIAAHDFVIVNSLALFSNHDGLADILVENGAHRSAVYLHETEWGFDRFAREHPERYEAFRACAPELNFLCVSQSQRQMLEDRFGVKNARVVYNTTNLPRPVPVDAAQPALSPDQPLKIVMAGTIQPRKGVTLFSEVADLAAVQGLPWTFQWAGWTANADVYRSPNVDFVGNLDQESLFRFITDCDVFLLSSQDDPFPLACLEAMMAWKRIVVYKGTGIAEILQDAGGTAIYGEYQPQAALAAIRQAVTSTLDVAQYERITNPVRLKTFIDSVNEAITTFWQEGEVESASPAPLLPTRPSQKVAVIIHLYYHDIWGEIRSYIRNLSHIDHDLYVSITTDYDDAELAAIRAEIQASHPDAVILECENRGMDIGPFVATVDHIRRSGIDYDLILKIHSKKSIVASGLAAGAQWRRDLYEGLIGSPTLVDRVLSLFGDYPHIGMVGPRTMLIDKSSKDIEAGANVNQGHMEPLADRLELSDRTQLFFRGSMFWCRAKPMLEAFGRSGLTIGEFDYGHQPDNSKAHAIERLFACVIRSEGLVVHPFDPMMPRPLALLKGAEAGKDIYVIAAGASCDHIDPSFFEGKCVIGVNRVFSRYACNYVIMKEHPSARHEAALRRTSAIPIVSKWDTGNIRQGKQRPNHQLYPDSRYYFFDHLENKREKVDVSVIDGTTDKIVVSYSTITSAIHIAAYLGARNIIIVGHDCGLLDGREAFKGYYETYNVSPWKSEDEYKQWLAMIEGQTLAVKEKVKEIYGCNIFSLNPFINFGLEGHVYTRALPAPVRPPK